MQNRIPVDLYQRAVRESADHYLANLGFRLQKRKFGVITAESPCCRIVFDPRQIIPFVQRISDTPEEDSPAYSLGLLLEFVYIKLELEFQLSNPSAVNLEINRMIGLLAEHCLPLLQGDDDTWQQIKEFTTQKESEAFARLSEAGLRLKEGDNWRELPELESVRVKKANKLLNTLVAMLLMLVPFTFTIGVLIGTGMFLLAPPSQKEPALTLIMTLFGIPAVLLQVWILKRFLLCPYYWETSEQGFTIGGYFRKRSINWADIQSVEFIPGKGYELVTAERSIKLDKETLKNICLEASIWQHLNRAGKADNLPLSPFAMSLWAQIPDTKTEEIHWESPKPPHALDILIRCACAEALIWGAAVRFEPDAIFGLYFIALFPLGWALFTLTLIKRISITDDRIQLTTALGKRSIHWNSVCSVGFLSRWMTQPPSLMIRAGILGYIRIPWYPQHPNSTRVMLAILRRLRQEERFKFLPFPAVLLLSESRNNQTD